MQDNLQEMLWNTTLLYPSPQSAELESAFSDAANRAKELRQKFFGKVATLDGAALLSALQECEALHESIIKPQMYAHLLFSSDSENDLHKGLIQKAMEFGNLMSRELLFFDLEIMALPDEQFKTLTNDAQLANYRHYLESVRKYRNHTLAEREEQLLKQKNLTGAEAFSHLFDEVSASFRYQFELDGETHEMTGEELLGLLHHPDAGVRERAFSTFLNKHAEQGILFSSVFNNIALDHAQELELRGYKTPMEPTNIGNEIPEEVVQRLMKVTEENYPLAQEYFRLKARLLKLDKLKNTDVYAPLGESNRKYSFSEAKELVLAAYRKFNPSYGSIIEAFFNDGRIDALPRPGKGGGAYCMGITPSLPPFVLLNFTGNLRDVATVAHELGHGLHYVLAQRQTMLNYHAPLPLAETASVFGEMLLTRYLLERETDPQVKVELLCAKIEDIIATTFRQIVLTRFEERLHLERQQGLLPASRLGEIWWEENAKLFGDSVEMIEPYRWGWSYIPHFIHTRFYCYSYTFAELLVLSLYGSYLREGNSFLPRYEAILASGGSQSPTDTVRPAGIDLNEPGFWQKGYDFLRDLIDELKGLV